MTSANTFCGTFWCFSLSHNSQYLASSQQSSKVRIINIQCDITYFHLFSFQKHTMIHTNEYPFVCDICPRKYRTQDRLNLHKMRHKGIKNHECPICGLKKTTGHELNVHMNVHTRAKKFPCNLCNACFLNNGEYM